MAETHECDVTNLFPVKSGIVNYSLSKYSENKKLYTLHGDYLNCNNEATVHIHVMKLNDQLFEICPSILNCVPSVVNAPNLCFDDISRVIADPGNADSYVILPSQMNCAEYPAHDCIIHDIQRYINDRTGGPACQLIVNWCIGQFLLDNASHSEHEDGFHCLKLILQTQNRQKPKYEIQVQNGYVVIPKEYSDVNFLQRNLHDLLIVGAESCPVNGFSMYEKRFINMNHCVNLIYTSAIPINSYTNKFENRYLIEIANTILLGEYYGALKMAYLKGMQEHKRKNVFLMLIGGGVFRNNKKNIFNSIIRAIFMMEQIYGPDNVREILNIYIVSYKRDERMSAENFEILGMLKAYLA